MSELAPSWRRPRAFALLALSLGLAFSLVNPPFAVNDEDMHLARVYELTTGRLFSRVDANGEYHYVPKDYLALSAPYETINLWNAEPRVKLPELWQQLTGPRPEEQVRMRARAAGYSPIGYGPQLLVVWLLRHLNVSALVHLYGARLASVVEYVWLAWMAVVVSAELQWVFMAIALTPMALTQAAGVSTDGTVIGLSLLFFALAGKAICGARPLTRKERIGLALSAVGLTVCKPVYIVALTCLAALFWTQPGQRLRNALFLLGVLVLGLGVYLSWSASVPAYAGPPNPKYDAAQQLGFMFGHPLRTLGIAFRTTLVFGETLITETIFVRRRMSGLLRFSGAIAVVLYLQLLFGLAFGSARRAFRGTRLSRLMASFWLLACACGTVVAVASAIYLCCVEVGANRIATLQGRYFLPALPPLLLSCALVGRPVVSRWLRAGGGLRAYGVIGFTNAWCLFSLIGFHYFPARYEWPL